MKGQINPIVKEGDRIILYHMDNDPQPISQGTEGLVVGVSEDPFAPGERIIYVNWISI